MAFSKQYSAKVEKELVSSRLKENRIFCVFEYLMPIYILLLGNPEELRHCSRFKIPRIRSDQNTMPMADIKKNRNFM
jgi:hypothetical protein